MRSVPTKCGEDPAWASRPIAQSQRQRERESEGGEGREGGREGGRDGETEGEMERRREARRQRERKDGNSAVTRTTRFPEPEPVQATSGPPVALSVAPIRFDGAPIVARLRPGQSNDVGLCTLGHCSPSMKVEA